MVPWTWAWGLVAAAGSTKEQGPAHPPKLHPLKWKHRASAFSSSSSLPLPLLVNLIFPAHYQEEGAASNRCGTEYIQHGTVPTHLVAYLRPAERDHGCPCPLLFYPISATHSCLSLPLSPLMASIVLTHCTHVSFLQHQQPASATFGSSIPLRTHHLSLGW